MSFAAHPFADLLPTMTEPEYRELVESIRLNGQLEPITLAPDGQMILDGRHRARACAELGLQPICRPYDGPEDGMLAYVMAENVTRRHLDASQRAMIAADLETLGHGGARRGFQDAILHLDRAAAANALNVSPRSVADAKAVSDSAIPEIVAAVRQGHMPVSQAVIVARLSMPRQQYVAANMGNGKSMSTLVLSATRQERVEAIERDATNCPLSILGRTFPVIYADPPWHFEAYSAGGQQKGAATQYPTMPIADLCALPVADIAARDAVLFMWTVPAVFPGALEVLAAWGFTYKTFAVRVKRNIACGMWLRGQHDPLIVATRGSMPPPPDLHSSVFFDDAPPGPHSAKPDSVRNWIASAYPHAGRIELFGRTAAPGWTAWGNQAPALLAAD